MELYDHKSCRVRGIGCGLGLANRRTSLTQAAFEALAIALTLAVFLLWLRLLACLLIEQLTPWSLQATSPSICHSQPNSNPLTL